ncbi:hypothetical protein BO99DRAFT_435530 [Aspergillus violaceofuscus CBS 115571]|uniref:Uncharacterized protein n=1 Tax=Aspergillus violaceofuscus (strain CBS 115571) TaxID=1450538 RepID=A0A2V5GZ09_ASPV1|nr:hypothetical protein BO99DRAFT_435530 [Aspergillus violaceofuscus CBS 115571]
MVVQRGVCSPAGYAAVASDAEALIYGLQQFPALERITIIPTAHGWLYQPVYETPMIRAFPKGFNYPIPHGWPTAAEREPTPEAEDWGILLENVKEQWRGARLILPGYGTQLHHLPPALLQRPKFRRLDLPLIVRGQEYGDWRAFRNGNLRRALSEASSLKHSSLYATIEIDSVTN